ncbi:hypothetical protein [Lacticaseibacillus kribbianus]|uniref:hypothetical protein n=1 Tax=Lacticaseibacillus kribbianus TaxID=2926292 RepID=UPI001CD37A33|nr:hypothetical protein [Lacticaseibacillus kribbianus]
MDDDETSWLIDQANQLAAQAVDYPAQAFYAELADFLATQARRIDQAEGELDGRLWDHTGW